MDIPKLIALIALVLSASLVIASVFYIAWRNVGKKSKVEPLDVEIDPFDGAALDDSREWVRIQNSLDHQREIMVNKKSAVALRDGKICVANLFRIDRTGSVILRECDYDFGMPGLYYWDIFHEILFGCTPNGNLGEACKATLKEESQWEYVPPDKDYA